jgi:hypothetical protein
MGDCARRAVQNAVHREIRRRDLPAPHGKRRSRPATCWSCRNSRSVTAASRPTYLPSATACLPTSRRNSSSPTPRPAARRKPSATTSSPKAAASAPSTYPATPGLSPSGQSHSSRTAPLPIPARSREELQCQHGCVKRRFRPGKRFEPIGRCVNPGEAFIQIWGSLGSGRKIGLELLFSLVCAHFLRERADKCYTGRTPAGEPLC